MLGKLVRAEDPIWNKGVGRSFLRVRLEMDVNKPLVGVFWVPKVNREKV